MKTQIRFMKKACVLTGLLFSTTCIYSQDVLIKKNGDEVEVKVIKISPSEIEYKKWSNQEGPSYTLLKSEVFMIKYKNGDKDVFKEEDTAPLPTNQPNQPTNNAPIKVEPSSDNASLIEQYNKIEHKLCGLKTKNKEAKCWWGTIGVTQSSVLSSDEIQITISQEKKSYPYFAADYDGGVIKGIYGENALYFWGKYFIEIVNKTSQTVYIDKVNSFRIESDGRYHVYYNPQQTTTNQGSGSGGGLNLGAVTGALGIGGVANTLAGGANVGGGSQSSVSTTYSDQRVVAIPPYGKMVLSKDEAIPVKVANNAYSKFKMKSFSEDFKSEKIPSLQYGEYKTFSEQDTPANKKYIVTYSLDPEFKSNKQCEFGLYIKDIIGGRQFFILYDYDYFVEKYVSNMTPNTIIVMGGKFK